MRGALIMALVLLALNLTLLWMANRSLDRAMMQAPELRRRLADFAPPAIPRLENASNYMDAAGALCTVSTDELRSLSGWTLGSSGTQPTDVWRRVAQRNALALQVLDASEGLEHAWFETVYQDADPLGAKLPSFRQRRCLANVLRARALLAAAEGRGAAAYRDVVLTLRLGDWCSQESPALISGLVAIAVTDSGLGTLEQVMSFGGPDQEIRRTLEERLAAARLSDPIRRGLEGERTVQFQFAQAVAEGTAQVPTAFSYFLFRFPLRFYMRLEQAASLRATTTLIARCARSTFELEKAGEAEIVVPRWLPITRIALPSLQRAVASRDAMRAHIDLGRIALDAETYRGAHGSYPPAPIEGWSTTNLIDPVSGSAYLYEPFSDGIKLSTPASRQPAQSWTLRSPEGTSQHALKSGATPASLRRP